MLKSPVLDDLSYRRLLNEALARIPSLTDKWTDFNPQDTGVMLLELLAGMTEMQNFYLDQVGDRFNQRLLALMLDSDANLSAAELNQSMEAERTTLKRAVTAEDYRIILMIRHRQEFQLDGSHIQIDGKEVRISVWRKDNPLTPDELKKLEMHLEKYRLLTVRVFVKQAETAIERGGAHDRKAVL